MCLSFQGRSLLDGCSHGVLCEVLVGDGQCRITEVTDNVITCVPPKEKPRQSTNDSFCNRSQPNSLTIEVQMRKWLQTLHSTTYNYSLYCLDAIASGHLSDDIGRIAFLVSLMSYLFLFSLISAMNQLCMSLSIRRPIFIYIIAFAISLFAVTRLLLGIALVYM